MRTVARSSSKRNSASARASSVLPTPVGPEEQERADRPVRVRQAGPAAADGVGHRGHGLVLADDPLVQQVLEVDELVHLALHQLAHGHARPLGHHLGDVLGVDLLLQHAPAGLELVQVGRGVGDAALQLGDAPVADLGRLLQVGLPLELGAQAFQLLLERADGADGLSLGLPVLLHLGRLRLQLRQLVLERGQPLLRRAVGLLGQGHLLDLELEDAPVDDVDLGRQRVDLDAQLARSLVHEVDGLVGQEAAGEVAVGEDGRADERGVLDAHAVVHLVALLQAAEDGDGVLHRRLADVHLLEAALERRVLLDVLAVLVERGGADHAQLAAGQHRLDHVAGVHRAFGRAGTDDRVQLVDERDDLAGRVRDLLEDGLQPLLELASVLGAGQHAADVQSATRRLPFNPSGTSPAAMRPARPSTMAVLPTPGSPISTGLFFVRRDSTWMTRRISSSRPMTGSILPSRARWVRSCP